MATTIDFMKILVLHGWQSIPGGVKPTYLGQHGHEIINPKLPDEDFTDGHPDRRPSSTNRFSRRGFFVGAQRGVGLQIGGRPPIWDQGLSRN
jgi:hypothetical protein